MEGEPGIIPKPYSEMSTEEIEAELERRDQAKREKAQKEALEEKKLRDQQKRADALNKKQERERKREQKRKEKERKRQIRMTDKTLTDDLNAKNSPFTFYKLPNAKKLFAFLLGIAILLTIVSASAYGLNRLLKAIVPYGDSGFSHWWEWINSFDPLDVFAIYTSIGAGASFYIGTIAYIEYRVYRHYFPEPTIKPNYVQVRATEGENGNLQYVETHIEDRTKNDGHTG